MHAVVEFTDGLEVEVIPSAWLTENKKKAYWPMWRNMTKIQSAIKQCLKPGQTKCAWISECSMNLVR